LNISIGRRVLPGSGPLEMGWILGLLEGQFGG